MLRRPAAILACALVLRFRRAALGATLAVMGAGLWAGGVGARGEMTLSTRSWRMEQGLPENQVTCVRRTRDGYAWAGTRLGLVRFDGARFLTFTVLNTPELRSDHITALEEDAQGALWIGTKGGGVARLAGGKFTSFSVRHGLSSDVVQCLAADREGALWIGTIFGLNRWKDGKFDTFFQADGLPGQEISSLACDARGTLWVAAGGRVVIRADGRFQTPAGFPALRVAQLAADGAGDVWINGREHGLLLAEGGAPPLRQMLPLVGPVDAMAASPAGGVWAALASGAVWQGGRGGLEPARAAFAPRSLLSLWDGGQGALLAGTREEGLAVIAPRFFEAHAAHQGPGSVATTAVAEDRAGRIWTGGERGWLAVWHEQGFHVLELGPNYPARSSVLSLCARADGSVWIGTRGDGVFRWDRGQVSVPRMEGRMPAAVAAALHEARDGTLWIGTEAEGVLRFQDGVFTRFTSRDGLARDQATTIAEEPDGTLWFGTAGAGLSQWKEGRWRVFTRRDGLAADTILAQHVDAGGRLWVGTSAGLSLWQDGKFFTFTRAHGLGEDVAAQITTDGAGHLWIGSLRGVARCARAELLEAASGGRERVTTVAFGHADGLPGTEFLGGRQNTALCDRAGRVWLTTTQGLARTAAAPSASSAPPPPVYLERVVVNDREELADPLLRPPAPPAGPPLIEVPPGHAAVAFHFTALAFRAPEKTRFRYQFDGLDDDWSAPQSTRSALYSRVPAGRYTFRLAACDEGGVWSAGSAAAVLVVRPFYWQTWWFRAALVGAAGLAVAAVIALRRARRREVERLRWRIAGDLHDELGSTLSGIALLSRRIARQDTLGPRERSELAEISDAARQTIHAVRDIVWFINPACDTAEETAQRMRETAARLLANIPHTLSITATAGAQKVPPDFRRHLLMAFKEVLHNAARHAQAGHIDVMARLDAACWTIRIADDGCGFDPANPHSGSGLKNTRLRLERMGGAFRLETEPGRGTVVEFSAHPHGR